MRRIWKMIEAHATSIYLCRNVRRMLGAAANATQETDPDKADFYRQVAHSLWEYDTCAGTYRKHLLRLIK